MEYQTIDHFIINNNDNNNNNNENNNKKQMMVKKFDVSKSWRVGRFVVAYTPTYCYYYYFPYFQYYYSSYYISLLCILQTVVGMAPFPFPGLADLRDKYTYNITPWTQSVSSVAKRGLRLFYSDDDDDDNDEDNQTIAVATAFGLSGIFRKSEYLLKVCVFI